MKHLSMLFFGLPGVVLFLWGFFCLLGGPDGKAGSLESVIWGGGFVIAGGFFIYLSGRLSKKG